MKGFKSMAIIRCLSVVFIAVFLVIPTARGEHAAWDCPSCGRTGNTGNYCGGCGHPAPWLETEEEADELKPYRSVVDKIEAIAAGNPWSLEDIMQAFVEKYGSEKAVKNLEYLQFHRFEKDGVELSYYNSGGYFTYSVRYYDEKHENYLFEHEYIRVSDKKYCDTSTPTYTNWFSKGVTLYPLTATSGNTYHLYYGEGSTDQYVDTEYYDDMTVSEYVVWDGWDFYVK